MPNGSPPQNDFRARSNGILPLNAAPVPWPPIVDNGGKPGARHAAAPRPDPGSAAAVVAPAAFTKADDPAAEPAAADESPTDVVQPLAADVDTAIETAATDEAPTDPEPAAAAAEVATEPAVAADSATETAAPASPPPLAETPGWRPRR